MATISVTVEDKIVKVEQPPIFVCNNTDYVISFTFDSEWTDRNEKVLRLLFRNGTYYDVPFTGTECNVPLVDGQPGFFLGVYSGNLYATSGLWIEAKKSILDGGDSPVLPEDYVYEQILEESWGTEA